jgi:ferredoxin
VFEPDDEGHRVVSLDEVPEQLLGQARLAVGNCPDQAILHVDD